MKKAYGLTILIALVILAMLTAVFIEVSVLVNPDAVVSRVEIVDGRLWVYYSDGTMMNSGILVGTTRPNQPQQGNRPSQSESVTDTETKAPEPETEYRPEPEPETEIPETEMPEPETETRIREYTVSFVLEGVSIAPPAPQTVREGNRAQKPKVSVDAEVGSFDGVWYTKPTYESRHKFDFSTPITEDITLYGYVEPNPAAPVWIIDADGLAGMTNANAATVEKNEAGYASFTATDGDPWFLVTGNIGEMPEYMVMRYRTNTTQTGEFFIGNGAGPEGGKSFVFNYNANSEWNLLVFHLPTVAPYMTDGTIGHIRFDFYTGGSEEGAFLDVAYIAFFNTAEYAEDYDFENYPPYIDVNDPNAGRVAVAYDTFWVNGQDYFNTGATGNVGAKLDEVNNTIVFGADAAVETIMLRGWAGFSQPIVSFGYYIDDYNMVYGDFAQPTEDPVKQVGGEHASRFMIEVPLADLEGVHKVGFVAKLEDGTVVRFHKEITVILPYEVPNHIDEVITLGHGHGNPYTGAPNYSFGQRYNIGENFLKNVSIQNMATYTDWNRNTWSFKVWQWNTDYATTTAAEPLYSVMGENHIDNTTFSIDIPAALMIRGDIYYEIEYLSGSGCFTGWTADSVAEGVETYVSGSLAAGTYASAITVGSTHYSNYNVPQEQWTVTGHCAQIVPSEGHDLSAMVAAGGVESAALLHQGSIYLGDIDLSKYEKVVIYWGTDNSQVTIGHYNASANNRIVLLSADMNMVNSPEESTIIAGATYELKGWAVTAFEIDLTGVDYNGPVYVAIDTLPGTYMLVSSVEFIGGEIGAETPDEGGDEPDAPVVENLVIDLSATTPAGGANYVPAWPEAGWTDTPVIQMMNWGSHIGLGEIDLSKYSAVVVTYGSDASAKQGDVGTFMALTKNGAAENADSSDKTDAEIIAQATMANAEGGWTTTRTVTIAIDSDYVGQVYLAQDMKDGNGIAITSIEFIAK